MIGQQISRKLFRIFREFARRRHPSDLNFQQGVLKCIEVWSSMQILVPIHQDIHWCLAVINIRDKQLEYLDSLKGGDHSVLDVLVSIIPLSW